MPTTTNEALKASQAQSDAARSAQRAIAGTGGGEMAWLEFPLAVVSYLLVPRLWFDDAQVLVNGGSIDLMAALWPAFFFLVNLALGYVQLRLFFMRLSRVERAAAELRS